MSLPFFRAAPFPSSAQPRTRRKTPSGEETRRCAHTSAALRISVGVCASAARALAVLDARASHEPKTALAARPFRASSAARPDARSSRANASVDSNCGGCWGQQVEQPAYAGTDTGAAWNVMTWSGEAKLPARPVACSRLLRRDRLRRTSLARRAGRRAGGRVRACAALHLFGCRLEGVLAAASASAIAELERPVPTWRCRRPSP
jgi:hypothetical protein